MRRASRCCATSPSASTAAGWSSSERAGRPSLLSDREVETLAAGMSETAPTPAQLAGIQAATEGNPLFVEHSLLYLAESQSMVEGATAASAGYKEEDLELAQSVRGLIGRRIERLSEPAQRVLVAAGVIGKDFDAALLEGFGEVSGNELRD